MKLDDTVWGALVLMLSFGIFFAIRNFPTIPGQQYGPALFPGVIATGLLICGSVLVGRGVAARRTGGNPQPSIRLASWVRSPRHVIAFAVVIGINVLYIAFVERLGFIVSGTLYLAALFGVFRVRGRWIVPLAIGVTLVMHYAFYKLLRVPLPWGVLEGIAW